MICIRKFNYVLPYLINWQLHHIEHLEHILKKRKSHHKDHLSEFDCFQIRRSFHNPCSRHICNETEWSDSRFIYETKYKNRYMSWLWNNYSSSISNLWKYVCNKGIMKYISLAVSDFIKYMISHFSTLPISIRQHIVQNTCLHLISTFMFLTPIKNKPTVY